MNRFAKTNGFKVPNARAFRQYIAQNHYKEGADIETIEKALALIDDC